ncbi:MAG: response regulator, partial [Gammaproteobacteria bacterium]|nr:response regulator [Gammaproteobacteria bacterium]
ILLVDDSKTICAIYSSLLTNHGYEVIVANSIGEALELALQHQPKLAIVDFYMPEGNGDELIQSFRKNPATASIVVAIHSQFPDVITKSFQAGAVQMIGKDDPQELFLMRVDALRTMIEAQAFQYSLERLSNTNDTDHPISILLVDDSHTIRAVYGEHLRNYGFDVFLAESLERGREVAKSVLPDMMLVDFILSDGRGDDLIRELLSQIETSNILMVIFSNKEDLEETVLGAGAIDIISKDDPVEVFMRRINSMSRFIQSQRKQREIMMESRKTISKLLVEAEDARRAADNANNSKDEFLASMSHELRTPLTAIIGNSELITLKIHDPEILELVDAIASAGHGQLALVNDILDMSKIESGKFSIDERPYNLSVLLHDVAQMFSIQAHDAGLQLVINQTNLEEHLLLGDGQRVGQILNNLISNGIKFTETGTVSLTTQSDGRQLIFTIKDSGIGMSPNEMDRLFKRFEQADGSISRRFGGSGLGLYISLNLAELMGGTIDASSQKGVGSIFKLTLPYQLSNIPVSKTQSSHSESILNEKIEGHVLVAEDTPLLQQLERRFLENIGITVTIAENGQEAVDLAMTHTFDLIFMDMQMPIMDGIEATRKIKQSGSTVPIIAVTANVMQKHRDAFEAAGCDDFMAKPFEKETLMRVLRSYLKRGQNTITHTRTSVVDDKLMEVFYKDTTKNREELIVALAKNDLDSVREISHNIKGSASLFGHPELSEIGKNICNAIETEQAEQVTSLTHSLITALEVAPSVCTGESDL